jgi:hypothetical protein
MSRNSNKLLEIVGRTTYSTYGVLETPCFPCTYYGYVIREDGHGGWMTTDNSFIHFKATVEEAREWCKKMHALHVKNDGAART